MFLFDCFLIVTGRLCEVFGQKCSEFVSLCQKRTGLCILIFFSLFMVDLKSLQGVFFTIYSKQILVGFSQPVRLTTNVNINFLYDFLGDLYDDLFYNLLNFCFFFLGPVRLYHLLDKIIIVFRKLWTNVIVDATFGFKSFNHVPFS